MKDDFEKWFFCEFPGCCIKIINRHILGENLTQIWFSTLSSWDEAANSIDLNSDNLLIFDYWHEQKKIEIGAHSHSRKYKEKGLLFRKQKANSELEYYEKVKLWLLKNKSAILTM